MHRWQVWVGSRARIITKQRLLLQIGGEKGRAFQFLKFISKELFHIYFISRNYAIPQIMPHAIPQTHAAFYPQRVKSRVCYGPP